MESADDGHAEGAPPLSLRDPVEPAQMEAGEERPLLVELTGGDTAAHEAEKQCEDERNTTEQGNNDDEVDGQWVAQYDPASKSVYYYDAQTGSTQWERPRGFVQSVWNEKVDGAVKIQSVFRSKKARDHVRQLNALGDADTQGPPTIDNMNETKPTTADQKECAIAGQVWSQHYDPRTQQNYFHNIETGDVTWEKPGDEEITESDRLGSSATRIQCSFRQKAATKMAETRRITIRGMTDPVTIDQKLRDLVRSVDEIQADVESRKRSVEGSAQYAYLIEHLTAWGQATVALRERVLDHVYRGQLVNQLEMGATKICKAEELHDAMAVTRTDCVHLLRDMFLMSSQFLEANVTRVNAAYSRYIAWRNSDLCTNTDPKILKAIHADNADEIFGNSENRLRRAMGLTDFTAGATSSTGKTYESWRVDAQIAVEAVHRLEETMQHKLQLLEVYHSDLILHEENELMQLEDTLSKKYEASLRINVINQQNHMKFVQLCRESWSRGLQKRQEESTTARRKVQEMKDKRQLENTAILQLREKERTQRNKVKFSIWEATKEGYPVDVLRAMIFAEMQKARRHGYDFSIRGARSEQGESLVQIACWWGHLELVEFFLDEGADLHGVDSYYNHFTLLHDAARRGHSQIIRHLVGRGIKHDVVDRSGDTPLHWAARMNQYEAVHTLVNAHMPNAELEQRESALRAVRMKNQRGRTPARVTSSEGIRRLIQASDEGRLQIFRHASSFSPTSTSTQVHGNGNRFTVESDYHTPGAWRAVDMMTRNQSVRCGKKSVLNDGGSAATLTKSYSSRTLSLKTRETVLS